MGIGESTSFGGSRIHFTVTGKRCMMIIAVCFFLFPLLCLVFNNIMFAVSYEGDVKLTDDFIAEWDAEDPRLIKHIREHYLYPPSPRHEPYNLVFPNKRDYSHKRQAEIVEKILNHKKKGFFFEAGAYDGETYSNSLSFEKYLDWSGLLIEPDFANIKRLRAKNRKAWLIHGCLDGTRQPKKMTLYGAMEAGTLSQYMSFSRRILTSIWRPTQAVEVWCFPLISTLLAVNQTKVDYMVLDIEGSEMPVLRGTDWNKVHVDVFQIEYMIFNGVYWDKDRSALKKKEMREFMQEHMSDYKEHSIIFLDMIYVRKDMTPVARK